MGALMVRGFYPGAKFAGNRWGALPGAGGDRCGASRVDAGSAGTGEGVIKDKV